MFGDEERSLPQRGAPERCFTRVGSGLSRKHYTRLERLATDKHLSLLRKSVNYGRKMFYSTGPWCQGLKTHSSYLTTGSNKLECHISLIWKCLPWRNTLAFCIIFFAIFSGVLRTKEKFWHYVNIPYVTIPNVTILHVIIPNLCNNPLTQLGKPPPKGQVKSGQDANRALSAPVGITGFVYMFGIFTSFRDCYVRVFYIMPKCYSNKQEQLFTGMERKSTAAKRQKVPEKVKCFSRSGKILRQMTWADVIKLLRL